MKCENCGSDHGGSYGSGRFCSSNCARSFSTKTKRKEINKKVSSKLKGRDPINKGLLTAERYETECKHCGTLIVQKSSAKEKKFCSQKCYSEFTLSNKSEYEKYKVGCRFKFNVYDYPELFDLELIDKYGWYKAKNRGDNLNGVSRDHIFSVREGFLNSIPPEIISHPLNCQLLRHRDNQKKRTRCDITKEELIEKVSKFVSLA